jgi:hypothetical protein
MTSTLSMKDVSVKSFTKLIEEEIRKYYSKRVNIRIDKRFIWTYMYCTYNNKTKSILCRTNIAKHMIAGYFADKLANKFKFEVT